MDQGPLAKEEIDAGAELVREFDMIDEVYIYPSPLPGR